MPNISKLFPCILIVLQLVAAIVYLCKGDFRHFFYWLFAAGITVVVIF